MKKPFPIPGWSRSAKSTRLLLVGVCAWISVCLLIAGWLPDINSQMGYMWLISGALGLASAVGLAEAIKADMRDQENLLRKYVQAALTDSLTGLANRHALDQTVEQALVESRAHEQPLAIVMVDIDFFKSFNDQWGHQAGDEVLRCVSRKMQEHFGELGTVARFGGEEFAILLPNCHLASAERHAEVCRQLVRTTECRYRDLRFHITVSCGVTDAQDDDTPESFLQRADMALYAAKKLGRDCVWVADPRREVETPHDEPRRSPLSIDAQPRELGSYSA